MALANLIGQFPSPISYNGYNGWLGYQFTMTADVEITALGRPIGAAFSQTHEVAIYVTPYGSGNKIATVSITPSSPTQDGSAYEILGSPVTLTNGTTYRIAGNEFTSGDQLYTGAKPTTITNMTISASCYGPDAPDAGTTSGDASGWYGMFYNDGDTTAPVVSSATIPFNGDTITINFTEADSIPLVPATGATGFTLTASGGAVTISNLDRVSDTVYTGDLSRNVEDGETVTLDATSSNVADGSANALADFTGTAVTNNSLYPISYTDLLSDPNLEAYWALQETTGTTIADSSGNARDGTTTGMPANPVTVAGPNSRFPSAISFDGTDDWVSGPSTVFDACESNNAFTFFCWIKFTGLSSTGLLSATTCTLNLDYVSTGGRRPITLTVNSTEANYTVGNKKEIAAGEWYSVAGTFDGTSLKIYVNGDLVGELAGAQAISTGASAFRLGSNSAASPQYLDGAMAGAMVFSRALTAAEIWALDNGDPGGAARNTITTAEVLLKTEPKLRLTQTSAEVMFDAGPKVRNTQIMGEVLYDTGPDVRTTATTLQVLYRGICNNVPVDETRTAGNWLPSPAHENIDTCINSELTPALDEVVIGFAPTAWLSTYDMEVTYAFHKADSGGTPQSDGDTLTAVIELRDGATVIFTDTYLDVQGSEGRIVRVLTAAEKALISATPDLLVSITADTTAAGTARQLEICELSVCISAPQLEEDVQNSQSLSQSSAPIVTFPLLSDPLSSQSLSRLTMPIPLIGAILPAADVLNSQSLSQLSEPVAVLGALVDCGCDCDPDLVHSVVHSIFCHTFGKIAV